MKTAKKQYLGVYALLLENAELLLVKKKRGPYKGRWDLPGGAPLHGEKLEEALSREVREETGIVIQAAELFTAISHRERYRRWWRPVSFYHVGLLYMVFDYDREHWSPMLSAEDVGGSQWWDLEEAEQLPLTPFALHALARIMS